MNLDGALLPATCSDLDRTHTGKIVPNAYLLYFSAGVFVFFFALFALLRTKNILAVDGGIRCFELYRRPAFYFDVNNHLLQPAHVWAWTRAAAVLGYKAAGPLQFYSLVQLMNCFAGAACLAILFGLLYSVVPSWRLALAATIGYGFTKAFLVQATNANETPMGLFWSFLALLFAALCFRIKSNWPVLVSASLFALAMATYQTMILLFPAAIVLIWTSRSAKTYEDCGQPKRKILAIAPQLRAFAMFAATGLIVTAGIFGYAYWTMHINGTLAMIKAFFTHEDAKVYFGVTGGKALNLPVGLIRNVFPVARDFSGIHNLLSGPASTVVPFLVALVLFVAFLTSCLFYVWKQRQRLSPRVRSAFIAAAVGLLFSAVPLAIWSPNYEKFWLQPLACLAFLIALSLHVMSFENRRIALASRIAAGILLAGILSNSVWAVRDHARENLDLRESQRMADVIGNSSLVVGGWDATALLYGSVWAPEGGYLDFTEDAAFHGRRATDNLRAAVTNTQNSGGHVYFVGILDLSPYQWDDFLGSKRCGIPYSDLDAYRNNSSVISTFSSGASRISLYRFNPPSRQ